MPKSGLANPTREHFAATPDGGGFGGFLEGFGGLSGLPGLSGGDARSAAGGGRVDSVTDLFGGAGIAEGGFEFNSPMTQGGSGFGASASNLGGLLKVGLLALGALAVLRFSRKKKGK